MNQTLLLTNCQQREVEDTELPQTSSCQPQCPAVDWLRQSSSALLPPATSLRAGRSSSEGFCPHLCVLLLILTSVG